MYFRILINSEDQEAVQVFRNQLQAALLGAEERELEIGSRWHPVANPDYLEGLRSYYITGHQHRLGEAELEELVTRIYVEVFGNHRNYQFRVLT